jgi:osmotically inducible protein OsmC
MAVRKAEAVWKGGLRGGKGTVSSGSGLFQDSPYSFSSRFEEGVGTNPEELVGAALAGCFSMAFAADLEKAGYKPQHVHTVASVHLAQVGGAFTITRIHLETDAQVPDIEESRFLEIAEGSRKGCPVSRALAVEKTLDVKLVK